MACAESKRIATSLSSGMDCPNLSHTRLRSTAVGTISVFRFWEDFEVPAVDTCSPSMYICMSCGKPSTNKLQNCLRASEPSELKLSAGRANPRFQTRPQISAFRPQFSQPRLSDPQLWPSDPQLSFRLFPNYCKLFQTTSNYCI